MCLITENNKKPKIAKSDIFCYKAVIVSYFNKDYMVTVYRKSQINIGCSYNSKLANISNGRIEEGLHSFCSFEDIERFISIKYYGYPERYKDIIKIVRCVIPKGSQYYKGIFNLFGNQLNSYASDSIIYEVLV